RRCRGNRRATFWPIASAGGRESKRRRGEDSFRRRGDPTLKKKRAAGGSFSFGGPTIKEWQQGWGINLSAIGPGPFVWCAVKLTYRAKKFASIACAEVNLISSRYCERSLINCQRDMSNSVLEVLAPANASSFMRSAGACTCKAVTK